MNQIVRWCTQNLLPETKYDGRVISVTNERTTEREEKNVSHDKKRNVFIRKQKSRNINIQYAMKLEFFQRDFYGEFFVFDTK